MEQEPLKSYSFKAGIMNFNEDTKLVSADKRKGIVTVQKFDGTETRFTWQENLDTPEEFEVYVFPQCGKIELSKQRDRVLILFNQDDPDNPEPLQFFWIQEKNVNKDKDIVKEVNEMINMQPDEDYEDIEEEEQDEQTGLLQQQQNNNNNQAQQQQGGDLIQQMMAQMQQMQGQQGQQQQGQQGQFNSQLLQQMLQQQQKKESPYLSRLFTPEYLEEIANDKDFQEVLVGELPEGQKSVEQLLENLKSPQFQQALESLDKALNSEGGPAVLMSMGLDAEGFQQTVDGNEALYKALEKYAQQQNNKNNQQ